MPQVSGRLRLAFVHHALAASALAVAPLFFPLTAAGQSESPAGRIDEIVVTARKRPEALSQVPVSVQVVDAERLADDGLSSLYELQYDVPGLVLSSAGGFGAKLALRGVTDQGGGGQAVAVHADGIYLGRPGLSLARLFDVERVEVLKGPQGTLYGRNATGGSINIVRRAPEDDFGAALEAATGSFDTVRANGHVNVPLATGAARLSFTASDGDGYIRNSVDSRRFAADDWFGVRAGLRLQPGDTTVTLSAERTRDDGGTGELWLPRLDFLPDPGDIHRAAVTLDDPYLDLTNDLLRAEVSRDTGALTWRLLSGYARSETRNRDDCAGLPRLAGCVRELDPLVYEQWSQELQLVSDSGGATTWLAGLYALDGREHTRFTFSAPLIAPFPINDYDATSRQTAYAAFGQLSQQLDDHWRLGVGLRQSYESNRVSGAGTGLVDDPQARAADGSWNNTSWRLDLQYAPRERSVLYASAATGFKSGGKTTELLPTGTFDDYDPEHLMAFEVGIKLSGRDPGFAVAASAFDYRFRDLQVWTVALLANQVTSVIDNAAAARIRGLDVAASLAVADRLSLAGGFVWLAEREFVEFTGAQPGDIAVGNRLVRAPEWSASASVAYNWPLRRAGRLSAQLDYNYRSAFFFTAQNDPLTQQQGFGLLDLSLKLQSPGERWYLFAAGRNLADTDYFEQIFIQSSPGRPRRWELGVGTSF